jgi:hypothetical protein
MEGIGGKPEPAAPTEKIDIGLKIENEHTDKHRQMER